MKLIFAITASALVAALATAQDGGIRIGHRCTIVKGALVADSAQDFARALVMYREGDKAALNETAGQHQIIMTSHP
jgi:hypothetical protein